MAQQAVDFHIQEQLREEIEVLEEKPLSKELNRDIFSNDKAIKIDNEAIKIDNKSKVKARNFLTNVSYNRIARVDFKNANFVVDCFTFMIVYLNPFYLERKFESVIEREFVSVLWAYLMPESLYEFINIDQNMQILNKIRITHQDGKKILSEFLEKDVNHLSVLSGFLEKNAILYQYLFGNLFPKCFSRVSDYGISAKTLFNKYYHSFHLQKNVLDFVTEQRQIKQDKQTNDESPINMTTLFDVQTDDNVDQTDKMIEQNIDDSNKENIAPLKPKNKKSKRKSAEEKKQIREAKKKKLLEELNDNTKKMEQIKGKN